MPKGTRGRGGEEEGGTRSGEKGGRSRTVAVSQRGGVRQRGSGVGAMCGGIATRS